MKKIKVSEATGPTLDWLVAKAEDSLHPTGDIRLLDGRVFSIEAGDYEHSDRWQQYSPTTDWHTCGPLIERELIAIQPWLSENDWGASVRGGFFEQHGLTPLIAAMRCFVASRLGEEEEVEVPKELV